MTLPVVDRRAWMLLACAAVATACATTAWGQRVQFPTAAPSSTPYAGGVYPPGPAVYPSVTPQPALQPLPTYDPYANPALGAPPADVPYTAPAPSSIFGPTPPPSPTYGAPFPTPAAPPTTTPYNFNSPGFGQRGGFDYQNSDGTVAHLQRLLQQISVEQTWLEGERKPGKFGLNRTELAATFGVPIFYNPDTPLLITPGFAFNWLEGPVDPGTDLPPRVYDAYLDAAWYPRLGADWLHADLGVRTGVWSDFHEVNSHSLRILGRGLGVISLSPRLDVLAGVWYIDRNHIKLLPAGGVHWKPTPEWDAYIVFPNPKVRKRFVNIGSSEWWWYVSGEYGGDRWTVRREPSGAADDVDYNDIRVIGGLEWETQTQARGYVEVGYVFNREILFAQTHSPDRLGLDDTVMVRLGVNF